MRAWALLASLGMAVVGGGIAVVMTSAGLSHWIIAVNGPLVLVACWLVGRRHRRELASELT